MAREEGAPLEETVFAGERRRTPLAYFEENLFNFAAAPMESDGSLRLVAADSMQRECEYAAARVLSLVQETGCRYRDISVAVRGFEDYRACLESTFALYGIPLYTARRSDIALRALPSLISAAYGVIAGGWEYTELFTYLKTGLAGLSPEETDLLENYVILWDLRGSHWTADRDWQRHPAGYGRDFDEAARQQLARLNAIRRTVARPLLRFAEASRLAATAAEHAGALYQLLEDLDVRGNLSRRAEALTARGEATRAAEHRQLWDTAVEALDQIHAVLGAMSMDAERFSRLFSLVLSQYDVGTIPVSLDRVAAGDMDRMRRRSIRHLILLGAEDGRLPSVAPRTGFFSDDDIQRLTQAGLDRLETGADSLSRELCLIYNCVSLPSDTLDIVWPCRDAAGGSLRPSFLAGSTGRLFGLEPLCPDREELTGKCPTDMDDKAVNYLVKTPGGNRFMGGVPMKEATNGLAGWS